MRAKVTFVFAAALSLATTISTVSAQVVWVPSDETKCNIEAWVMENDPKGLNVRAAPSKDAAIIGKIPTSGGKYELSAELTIIGSHKGWLRITGARDYAASTFGLPPRKIYSGEGWVHGSRVGFDVRSGVGFERPDPVSHRLVIAFNYDGLSDVGGFRSVVACQGEWALLDFQLTRRVTMDPKETYHEELSPAEREKSRGRAWFRGICSIQETSCTAQNADHEFLPGHP